MHTMKHYRYKPCSTLQEVAVRTRETQRLGIYDTYIGTQPAARVPYFSRKKYLPGLGVFRNTRSTRFVFRLYIYTKYEN